MRRVQMIAFVRRVIEWLALPLFACVATVAALLARAAPGSPAGQPRLVWGSTPIISNSYWSRAMRAVGFTSETFTTDFYHAINKRSDWDRLLPEHYRAVPGCWRTYTAFIHALFRYDIFFMPFSGFFIGATPAWRLQAFLLRLAGKKSVLMPYGADAYSYRRIRSVALIHGLLMSYPGAARHQTRVAGQIDYWCRHADAVVTGIMGPDGFGRWDAIVPSNIFLDLDDWRASRRNSGYDGRTGTVRIAHAPNHRGFKGTEFVVEAVRQLQDEGLSVELLLLERMQNSEVKRCLAEEADILVEQLICTGHGLNALEGLASGLPVVSNLEDDELLLVFRRWSYLSECPIVSGSPESLVDVLRKLVTRPALRRKLGTAGREYVEKYHGLDSGAYLFTEVVRFLHGERESLINLYHPLLGEYPRRRPLIEHPLLNNRIAD
jgi:hypothetical protein